VRRVITEAHSITVIADPRGRSGICPSCRRGSDRIHSRYVRTLADLPWRGRPVVVSVRARRFRCGIGTCPRKTFVEPLSGVAAAHARRTNRLADVQRHVGLALGGAANARLARRLALPVSRDTLLRLVRAVPPLSRRRRRPALSASTTGLEARASRVTEPQLRIKPTFDGCRRSVPDIAPEPHFLA